MCPYSQVATATFSSVLQPTVMPKSMQGAVDTMVDRQALCSGAPSRQVQWGPPFLSESSGSGRRDSRCVGQRKAEEAVFGEAGKALTLGRGCSLYKSQAGVVRLSVDQGRNIWDTSAVPGHRPEQLFWGQVKYIFLGVAYPQPSALTWLTNASTPHQRALWLWSSWRRHGKGWTGVCEPFQGYSSLICFSKSP